MIVCVNQAAGGACLRTCRPAASQKILTAIRSLAADLPLRAAARRAGGFGGQARGARGVAVRGHWAGARLLRRPAGQDAAAAVRFVAAHAAGRARGLLGALLLNALLAQAGLFVAGGGWRALATIDGPWMLVVVRAQEGTAVSRSRAAGGAAAAARERQQTADRR